MNFTVKLDSCKEESNYILYLQVKNAVLYRLGLYDNLWGNIPEEISNWFDDEVVNDHCKKFLGVDIKYISRNSCLINKILCKNLISKNSLSDTASDKNKNINKSITSNTASDKNNLLSTSEKYSDPATRSIIGLTGKKRCGKSTFAKIVLQSNEFSFKELAFGNLLKDIVSLLFDIDAHDEEIKEKFIPRYNKTLREILQWFGSTMLRGVFLKYLDDPVNACIQKELDNNPRQNMIISDVRFPSEVKLIKDNGGIIIRIYNPSTDKNLCQSQSQNIDSLSCKCIYCHISEQPDKLPSDFSVTNNGTLDEYKESIKNIFNVLNS
jgi:dephospho-CoA kinase